MIKGQIRENLCKESILSRISEYDIYRKFYGDFKMNCVTTNIFRGDKNPSFIIGNRSGQLRHHDFSDDFWRGDCFGLVQQIHSCDYNTALGIIDKEFGLGISSSIVNEDYKKIVSQYKQPEDLGKRYSHIQVKTKKFTKLELDYWKQYHQDIQDLKDNHIYSISKLYLNKNLFYKEYDEIVFGYYYDGTWKIYFPFREKKRKWLSNVPLATSYGLENLNKDHNTLICKSLKDYMVCKKTGANVCGVQNESLAAFSEETVSYIKENSKEVFYGGDSDDEGKKASRIITSEFGFKHINPEDRLLPEVNDFADWGRTEGLDKLTDYFKLKELL